MTIAKTLIVATCILTASLTQAVSMENFDRSTLAPYTRRAQEALDTNKATATTKFKKTYSAQKSNLKVILKELKHNAKNLKQDDRALWLPARQLYKAFKHDVYENWKKTQSLPVVQEQQAV